MNLLNDNNLGLMPRNVTLKTSPSLTLSGVNPQVGIGSVGLQPVGGGPTVVANSAGGVQIRPVVQPAVPQSDDLGLASLGAGDKIVVDLGAISRFIDTAVGAAGELLYGDVLMLDPNGQLHDLWLFTRDKATAAGYGSDFSLPPGRYQFINVSGGALNAGTEVLVQHVGAANLI